MKLTCLIVNLLILGSSLFSQDSDYITRQPSLYLDIATELMARVKLSEKLPEVMDENKFQEIAAKLDNIALVESDAAEKRIRVSAPEYHWCFANLFHLIGDTGQAFTHYNIYQAIFAVNNAPLHEIFQEVIPAIEEKIKVQQDYYSKKLIDDITAIKSPFSSADSNRIKELQINLNEYNQFNPYKGELVIDGMVGPMTKSAIYDFEKINPNILPEEVTTENLNPVTNISTPKISPVKQISTKSNSDEEKQSTPKVIVPAKNSGNNNIEFSNEIIINSDKISSLPVSTVADLLEYIMGINIIKRGNGDGNASISAMGGTSQDVLILIDGFRILTDYTVYHDLVFPFGIDDINKIEISPGSKSRLYGSGAVSNVINIITKDAHGNRNRFKILTGSQAGMYGGIHNNLLLNIPTSHSNHLLSMNSLGSSGLNDSQNPYQQMSLYYKYIIENGANRTHMSFGYLDRVNSDSTSASNVYKYTSSVSKFFNTKIRWDFTDKRLESNIHWNNNIYSFDPLTEGSAADTSEANFLGYGFKGIMKNRFGLTTLGLLADGEEHSSATRERIHYSLNADHELKGEKNQFNFGISLNKYNDYSDKTYIGSGYGISHWLNNYTILYHSFNQGFRIPSFEELNINTHEMKHANGPLNVEFQNSFDYGIIINNDVVDLNFSMYFNKGDDVIEWQYTSDSLGTYWKTVNVPRVFTNGHKIDLSLKTSTFRFLGFIKNFDISYIFIDVETKNGTDSLRTLGNTFKHHGILSIKHALPFIDIMKASQSWVVRYEEPINLPNRFILDTQINLKIWKFQTMLSVNNLLGVEYYDEKSLNEFLPGSDDGDNTNNLLLPGTWVRFGIKFPV